MQLNPRFFIVLCLLCSASIWHTDAKQYDWNGFIAQGVIQADDSNYINADGEVSLRLTEVGINGYYRVNPRLRIAGQAVYLNGGNRYPEGARLDYLFADWQAINSHNWQVNLHLGRFKNYHWIYSATRDVPHTRASIILPQSIYFDVFRDVALGSDGIALLAKTNNSWGDWDINWSYGETNITQEQTRNLLSRSTQGSADQDFAHQFNVTWHSPSHQYQFGFNLLDSDFNFSAAEEDNFVDGDATSQRLMLMFQYSAARWDITSEVMRERVTYENLLFPGFRSKVTGEGGYLQGRYFATPNVTLMARVDWYDRDREDRDGRIFSASTGGFIPAYFAFMDQGTLGVTWQFKPKWQIQAEFHRVKGAGRLAPLLEPDILTNDKYWNIWALQVAHWF